MFSREFVTVVGVLNVTPDSFSDGGRFVAAGDACPDVSAAVTAALSLERAGAQVIDVGGESTRPGSSPVPAELEIARTAPVIEALARQTTVPISIDTRKAEVARAALAAGARVINDVSGGVQDPDLLGVAAESAAVVILGHLRGEPATMQHAPHFDDPIGEVCAELETSLRRAEAAGVAREQVVVDPGIGFGKRTEDNLALLAAPVVFSRHLGCPVLVGPSRKSFLGALTGDPVADRKVATVAACAVAIFAGADAIRVHDVGAGVRAARVAQALRRAGASAVGR